MPNNISNYNYRTEWISSASLIILGVFIWWYSGKFPSLEEGYPGPNLFPRIIAVGLGLVGVILINNILRKSNKFIDSKDRKNKNPLALSLGVAVVLIFPFISPLIGFLPALFLVAVSMGKAFKLSWWKSVLTGLVAVLMVYLIFSQLLGVLL